MEIKIISNKQSSLKLRELVNNISAYEQSVEIKTEKIDDFSFDFSPESIIAICASSAAVIKIIKDIYELIMDKEDTQITIENKETKKKVVLSRKMRYKDSKELIEYFMN